MEALSTTEILEISNRYLFKDCNSNGLAACHSPLDTAFMALLERGAHLDLDRMPL